MPTVTLSAEFVRKAECPQGKKKQNYYDTNITGFILEVRSTGGKTYALRYRDVHKRQCQHKIADVDSISFDKARQAALKIRSRVVLGENPAEERRVKRKVPTLAQFNEERYMPYIKGYKKSWESDDSYLRNHLLPTFGTRHLDEIKVSEVVKFHHRLKEKGYAPATANRMIVLLRYMYNLAARWAVPGAEENPTRDVKMFELNNSRERYLSVEETQRLREALSKSPNPQLQYIVGLLLLMGNRKRELLDAKWKDIDLERRLWHIPITKSGRSRNVPLSGSAVSVLAKVPKYPGCEYVFPNPKTRKPYVTIYNSWNSVRKAAGLPDLRMHDLRHSMASNMVNSGCSLYEVAKVLGHTQLKTTQRYSHLSPKKLLDAVDNAAKATGANWEE